MMSLHKELADKGNDSYVCWARGRAAASDHEIKIGTMFDAYAHGIYVRLTDRMGFASKHATRKLLKKLDEINPDVVHLHNLHGYYINIEMLFEWLAKHDCQVRWTLHDCWAFTGHCIYFTYVNCMQWQSHCGCDRQCPQLKTYPKTYSKANCAKNFEDKKRLFTSISPERMTVIVPSYWLAGLVKESFLGDYRTIVQHNTVDTNVFKSTPSDFRERFGIGNRFMILGVASPWTERKGFSDFIRLSNELDLKQFAVVLVGFEQDQLKKMPDGIIGLKRTSSPQELAAVYTAADVFFNPTKEDNYPTVNLEAEACGTPVITYDVGGCLETIKLPMSVAVSNFESAKYKIKFFKNSFDPKSV